VISPWSRSVRENGAPSSGSSSQAMAAKQPHLCSECSTPGEIIIGIHPVWREELRWGGSFRCAHCGNSLETDAIGPIDPETRTLLLSAEGTFGLVVEEAGVRALESLRILRKVLGISMQEASRLRQQMPGVVYRGLAGECEWLREHLKNAGFQARTEPC